MSDAPAPLQNIRVLELGHIVAGPVAGLMLAELGAEVLTGTPEDYGRYLKGEIERWAKVIEFSGAKAE